jgi:hypothetical protein
MYSESLALTRKASRSATPKGAPILAFFHGQSKSQATSYSSAVLGRASRSTWGWQGRGAVGMTNSLSL